jgi:hypothetical protein
MKLLRLALSAAILLSTGCSPSPQVPKSQRVNYPVILKESSDRRAKAEREWRRLLDAYEVPQTPPDLYHVTYTPRSLLGVSGGIKFLSPGSSAATGDLVALRAAFRSFLDRWRDLIGIDPAAISLVSDDSSSNMHRLTFRQTNYLFQIAGPYGEMNAVLTSDGRLIQLDDRFIPPAELPPKPEVERELAAVKVVGRSFSYTDIAGKEQRIQISGGDEVVVQRIVILPLEKGDSLELHLAWEILAGKSLTWTVYVDAITGDELKAVQNFNT